MSDGHLICARREQLIRRNSCFFRNAPKQAHGWRMDAVDDHCNGGLSHPDLLGEIRLRKISIPKVRAECFHTSENIRFSYSNAISASYPYLLQNLRMQKKPPRPFLDRAMEALREKDGPEVTQKNLAKVMGISQPAVAQTGKANRYPSNDKVVRLALYTGVCVDWLYTERLPKYPGGGAVQPDEYLSPILQDWPNLAPEVRKQITRYVDFVRDDGKAE